MLSSNKIYLELKRPLLNDFRENKLNDAKKLKVKTLQQLPLDIIESIADYFPVSEQAKLCEVSKFFKESFSQFSFTNTQLNHLQETLLSELKKKNDKLEKINNKMQRVKNRLPRWFPAINFQDLSKAKSQIKVLLNDEDILHSLYQSILCCSISVLGSISCGCFMGGFFAFLNSFENLVSTSQAVGIGVQLGCQGGSVLGGLCGLCYCCANKHSNVGYNLLRLTDLVDEAIVLHKEINKINIKLLRIDKIISFKSEYIRLHKININNIEKKDNSDEEVALSIVKNT